MIVIMNHADHDDHDDHVDHDDRDDHDAYVIDKDAGDDISCLVALKVALT